MKSYNFAVVGATGLVGRTFLKVMEEYQLPINELHLFASSNSKGMKLPFNGKEYEVEELKEDSFKNIDFALFSAGASVSKVWAKIASDSGALVIDNSSQWRMDEDCALIVPEINLDDYKSKSRIIANPNCSTIQSVIPLKALDREFSLKKVTFTTYQAVSGSGKKGLDDLKRCESGQKNEFYPYDISKTCIPEIDVFLDNGYSKEEMKMVNETRKILHLPDLKVSATCIRVPVPVAHGVMMQAEFNKKVTVEKARQILKDFESIKVLDDPKNHIYPVSTIARGNDFVYVGRIRQDLAVDNGLLLYSVADNVRKGAASNAVQIAKKIIAEMER
ncbi:MAG: aspartate-semialdehyde dehydrogenase [Bacilli bacterium]